MLDNMHTPQRLSEQLETMHRLLSRSFGLDGAPGSIRSVAYGAFPEINVGRTPASIEVFAFAPGIDAASIDVTIERNVLKISGSRASAIPQRDVQVQLYSNERPEGRFSRAVTLPDDVDPLKVQAKYRDGILRVSIALSAAAQPQRIAVQ
ncbi:Hsp20/alpha crystallin family protein [Rhizobacter sp. SG703]|jgi:HSP20 family protein|uniref:Hsp20/alpha crystallin family protein n=1 Tax=Rhizobacter sp. SG703 TaxID=2587140 RepID=UPI0017E04FBF|nr:Hsp20/alpha crystallin family protein [Rhizobacter sp. SG703]NKI94898.1 HSP20 family protein [Rhizobacter sp. SG703]